MDIKDLYKLELKDLQKCNEMTTRAFRDYSMCRHVLGSEQNPDNIKYFLGFVTKFSILYGEAYATSSNMEGIILFTDFSNYYFSLIRSLKSGLFSLLKLGSVAGKRFRTFDEYTLKVHRKCISEPHQYVILIGVDPDKQGQGYGSQLMQATLKYAEEKGQPCYLETHGEGNVIFYKKLGFEVVSKDTIPGTDIVQYAMLKRSR